MAPKNAMAFNNRGLVYEKQGDLDRAGKDYFRACELGFEIGCRNYLAAENSSQRDRSQIDLLLRKSGEAYRDNDWEAVMRLTSLVIEKEPENVQAYTARAAAFSQTGQLQEAIADCNAAIQINPNYGLAYNNRGYALEKMGQREDALVDYRVGCLLGADLSCRNHTRLESVLR